MRQEFQPFRSVMAAWFFLAAIAGQLLSLAGAGAAEPLFCWQPYEIELTATGDHAWWQFPVRATFVREEDPGSAFSVDGYWDGDKRWVVRVAFPEAGRCGCAGGCAGTEHVGGGQLGEGQILVLDREAL